MISRPVFFPREDWVADHADWHPRIQGGKTIDVVSGNGRRVLAGRLERAARLRPDYEVGCIMISRSVFFGPDDWIADHADWHPRIQGGKTVDIMHGDGQRILFDDYQNGRKYERFAGLEIAGPAARAEWPDREVLEWHGAEVFRG